MAECLHCGKVFKYESERKRHELSHLPGFDCNKCGKKFTYLSALRRHQKQHERTGLIQCDQCDHSFKDETLLKRHKKYAHEGTNICSECDAKFNSKQALRIHMLTHKPKSERKYSCSFMDCNKTFNFSHHLKYHEMTHTNSRQYFCNVCGKGFIQSHNLKVHSKIHEPSKWLTCEITNCKKKFVSEYARKRHYARHNIHCTSCGQLFLSSFYKEHTVNCIESRNDISEDRSIDSLPKLNVEQSETSNKQDIPINSKVSEEYVTTCKAVLGKCLVTGDTNVNANCLCAQMVKGENNYNQVVEELTTVSDIKPLPGTIKKDNTTKVICEGCDCSTAQSDVKYISHITLIGQKNQKLNNCNSDNSMPEFEYGINGIVKVINTIDTELEDFLKTFNNKNLNKKGDFKEGANEHTTIPYNSCKAVLGTCIVSGNGMISDDCLCAKMLIDEQQMTSQEMEEITPQPNDSTMCL